jgi:autotransporter passenger strand-loop-strand repeat protein
VTQRVLRGGLELLSGGTATGTVVMSSGGQGITRNGVAINTVVSSGGQQALGGSGTPIASGTTVLSGGLLLVGTGQAVSAVVSSGGSVSVGDLGSAQGTTVFSGGSQTVAGHASGTVLSGGFEYVSGPNAVQLLALVDDGGAEYVLSGAQLASALMSGGAIVIDSGGLASGSIALVSGAFGAVQLNGTGNLGGEVSGFDTTDTFDFRTIGFTDDITALSWTQLASGGSASGTLTLASGGTSASLTLLGQYAGETISINNGQASAGLTVGGTFVVDTGAVTTIDVFSGGVADTTTVSAGGLQQIFSGGSASGTEVLSGGQEVISARLSAVLSSGASATVSNGFAFATTILSGATQVLEGSAAVGGVASGSVLNGGEEIVSGDGAREDLALVNSGGLELVEAGGRLDSATISGGVVEVGSGGLLALLDHAIAFAAGGGGTLQLDEATDYSSAGVSGFTSGDLIDFRAVAFTSGATSVSWTQIISSGPDVRGTLTVTSGGTSADITLAGNYLGQTVSVTNGQTSTGLVAGAGAEFASASDNSGGTDVTFSAGGIATIDVFSGGIASATTVSNGGLQQIFPGGSASGTVVSSGGKEIVSSGGVEELALVNSGGFELVAVHRQSGLSDDQRRPG